MSRASLLNSGRLSFLRITTEAPAYKNKSCEAGARMKKASPEEVNALAAYRIALAFLCSQLQGSPHTY
jgi:transposase